MPEMIDIHLHLGDKLESLWQFYISVHLAITGGIVVLPALKVRRAAIFMLLLAYTGFMVINGMGVFKTYSFMYASQSDIRSAGCDAPHQILCESLLTSNLLNLQKRGVMIFAVSWLAISIGIFFSGKISAREISVAAREKRKNSSPSRRR